MLHAMSRVVSIKTVILLFCLFSAQLHILAVCPCGIDGNRNATNPPPTAEDVSVQRLSIYLPVSWASIWGPMSERGAGLMSGVDRVVQLVQEIDIPQPV